MTVAVAQLTRADRLAGGLLGLLVGDALGVPYEFHPPDEIPDAGEIEFIPPQGFRRSHYGVPAATWSDDGAHALILLDSLLTNNGLDLEHLGTGLRRWLHQGYCAVDGSVFDIGAQTSTAINRLMAGVPPLRSGSTGESDNGNGSLMRVLPLALWHRGGAGDLARLAARQSLPTHGHARSQLCCAMYCLWARAILQGLENPWGVAEGQLRQFAGPGSVLETETETVLDSQNAMRVRGTGYVLDTLWSARIAVDEAESYEQCVRRAIRFGHDTDTTAAVAGGIAGLKFGAVAIPERWRAGLRGESIFRPLLDRLLAHAASVGDRKWD